MTNQKPPVDLAPIAEAAVQIAFLAFCAFVVYMGLR